MRAATRQVVALALLLAAPSNGRVGAPLPARAPRVPLSQSAPQEVAPQQPLLRLRGGDGGVIGGAQRAFLGVPVLTRSWLSAVVVLAGLSQIGLLPPEALAVDATAFVKGFQLWRPLTAACFLGGLGPQLLQKCYYLMQFGKDLERTLGLGEYARILVSCTALLSIVCAMLGWQFVGDGLIMAVTVLMCQQHPDSPVNMYGLSIPCAYLPFAQLCMSYMFTQQIPWNDILGALVGYVHYIINDNCKPDAAIYKRDNVLAQASTALPKGAKTLGSSGAKKPRPGTGGGGGGGSGSRKATGQGGKAKRSSKANMAATGANAASCGPGG